MKDFRNLPVWLEARRLTLAAFQFTTRRIERDGASALGREIQNTCVVILSAIQHLTEPGPAKSNPRKIASEALRRLTTLLGRAYAEGLISTFELALVMRELTSVNEFLAGLGPSELCCTLPSARAAAIWIAEN